MMSDETIRRFNEAISAAEKKGRDSLTHVWVLEFYQMYNDHDAESEGSKIMVYKDQCSALQELKRATKAKQWRCVGSEHDFLNQETKQAVRLQRVKIEDSTCVCGGGL